MSTLQHSAWAAEAAFIDHRGIDWARVKRTRYVAYQRFHYEYPGPIRNLRHHLVVVPTRRYGNQRLREQQLVVTPEPIARRTRADSFGNCVWDFEAPHVAQSIAFEVKTTVERTQRPLALPSVGLDLARHFLAPTRLTAADERIAAVAADLAARSHGCQDLAEQIAAWTSDALRYGSGTSVITTAAQALAHGQGLCQDYAHVMIAVCRAAGLPARYVSGHMLGEGGSHAWVEVLLPAKSGDRLRVIDFDPTNRRRPNLGYTTIALGRDYADVAPTSGSYSAPYSGRLSFSKRAGLTLLEYEDGEVIASDQ